jgi:error-prone DNA polymerase
LNSYPLGFYNPATLVKDAQRHGVEVRSLDVTASEWLCTMEPGVEANGYTGPAVRVGLRYVGGLSKKAGEAIALERSVAPFHGMPDLTKRVILKQDEVTALAELGALANLPGAPGAEERRAALWQVAALERDPRSLFAGLPPEARGQSGRGKRATGKRTSSPLPEMSPIERTLADYRLSGLTTGPQLLAYLREGLHKRGVLSAVELRKVPAPEHGKGLHLLNLGRRNRHLERNLDSGHVPPLPCAPLYKCDHRNFWAAAKRAGGDPCEDQPCCCADLKGRP